MAGLLLISALTIAGMMPLFMALDRTPIPWIDEVLWASTSLSVMNGQEAKPSVLDAFPGTGRFDLFYGPVGIYLGAWWMKIAGVSAWNWRMLSFGGGVSIVVMTALLARAVGGSHVLATTAACLVGFSTSMGSSLNSGRLDTVSIAFELAALLLLVLAMQQPLSRGWLYSGAAGIAMAAAALSTPRALTFCLGLVAGALALLILGFRKKVLDSFLPAAIVTGAAVWLWTHYLGLSPITWLQYLGRVSKGDRGNVSPILGGSWGSKEALYLPELAAPVLFAFLAICLCRIWTNEHENGSQIRRRIGLVFLLIVGLANMLLSIVLLSRALNYQLFFKVPVLIGLLVLSAVLLETTNLTNTRRLVIGSWLVFAVLAIGLRAAKIAELSLSWRGRNATPILAFVKEHVPPKSTVLGSEPCYFWAVQDSGSRYLWIQEKTTPGLNSHSIFNVEKLFMQSGSDRVYLVWKHDSAMPPELSALVFRKTGSLEMPNRHVNLFSRFSSRIGTGYPQTDLYELALR
jgi:hypothetical protein